MIIPMKSNLHCAKKGDTLGKKTRREQFSGRQAESQNELGGGTTAGHSPRKFSSSTGSSSSSSACGLRRLATTSVLLRHDSPQAS